MTGSGSGRTPRNALDRRLFVAGAGAIAGAPAFAAVGAADAPRPGTVVDTTAGKVRGLVHNGIHHFKGVPYGASTAGRMRFMAPVAPTPWRGVRDAFAFGRQSPQLMSYSPVLAPQAPASEGFSEDCLVLNVWTPGPNRGAKRPVMFWCHGGGFFQESGSWPWIDGENLARRGDVVVITVNHRLNVFGYLHLAELAGEKYAASGNAGMLDLVLALEWVRANVDAFGGDPDQVMIFGESGGGAKVCTLLAMPAAKGLFNRAAIQSGASLRAMPADTATELAARLLKELGVTPARIDELHALPSERLLAAMAPAQGNRRGEPGGLPTGFSPVLDGRHVAHHPFDPVASPLAAGIPVLVGCTRHEWSLFSLAFGDEAAFDIDQAGLRKRVVDLVGEARAEEALAVYRRQNPGAPPSELYFLMATDRMVRKNTTTLAERKAAQGAGDVYAYLFAWRSPAHAGRLGAPHTVEIPFVFDNTDVPAVMTKGGPEVKVLAAQVSDAWIAFARTGDPNHAGLPRWPKFDAAARQTMVFDTESKAVPDPDGDARTFWSSAAA